jgi:hypothetical protein
MAFPTPVHAFQGQVAITASFLQLLAQLPVFRKQRQSLTRLLFQGLQLGLVFLFPFTSLLAVLGVALFRRFIRGALKSLKPRHGVVSFLREFLDLKALLVDFLSLS